MLKALLLVALFVVSYAEVLQLAPVTPNGPQTSIFSSNGDADDLLHGKAAWNAGWWRDPPFPKFVEYVFDQLYEISAISLIVDQQPAGYTVHEIRDSNNELLYRFAGNTYRKQVLSHSFPVNTVTKSLRISTTESVSNAAWLQITIFGSLPSNPPVNPVNPINTVTAAPIINYYTQLAPAVVGSPVPTGIRSNNGNAIPLLQGTGGWNGGWNKPDKFIEYDFKSEVELDRIIMILDQNPAGNSCHKILDENEKELYSFVGYAQNFQELAFTFPPGTKTSSLKIVTTCSVSNTAWHSITIFRK